MLLHTVLTSRLTAQCREESSDLLDKMKAHMVEKQPDWVLGTPETDGGKAEAPDRWVDRPENSIVLTVRPAARARNSVQEQVLQHTVY